MTDEIEELRRMAMAATPGPWFANVYVDMRSDDAHPGKRFIGAGLGNLADDVEESDALFISAANPAAILRLLDRVEELDHECQQSMLTIALERERAEAAERQRDEALAKLARAEEAERALNERNLFINPDLLEQAADHIDCNSDGACAKTWHEWDTNAGGCHASERGDYCPNDIAETLRALAKVARAALAPQAKEGGKP